MLKKEKKSTVPCLASPAALRTELASTVVVSVSSNKVEAIEVERWPEDHQEEWRARGRRLLTGSGRLREVVVVVVAVMEVGEDDDLWEVVVGDNSSSGASSRRLPPGQWLVVIMVISNGSTGSDWLNVRSEWSSSFAEAVVSRRLCWRWQCDSQNAILKLRKRTSKGELSCHSLVLKEFSPRLFSVSSLSSLWNFGVAAATGQSFVSRLGLRSLSSGCASSEK